MVINSSMGQGGGRKGMEKWGKKNATLCHAKNQGLLLLEGQTVH